MSTEYQEQVPRLILELGYLSMQKGSMQQAQVLFEAAQALRPADPTPALFLGMLQFAQEQFPTAEKVYRQILQQHDGYDLARVYLAESLIAQKRWAEAEPLLTTVTQKKRDEKAVQFADSLLSALRTGIFQRAV